MLRNMVINLTPLPIEVILNKRVVEVPRLGYILQGADTWDYLSRSGFPQKKVIAPDALSTMQTLIRAQMDALIEELGEVYND